MECIVCCENVALPRLYEAPCSSSASRCARVCHIECAQRWLISAVAGDNDLAANGLRLTDCPCGDGVYAARCAVCWRSIVPPANTAATCQARHPADVFLRTSSVLLQREH